MSASVTVAGLDTLDRTLGDAAADLADLAVVNRRAGERVAGKAAGAAPVLSGALARSVRVMDVTGGLVEVGSPLPYARVIHNGWAAHNIRPNPFLAQAVDEEEIAAIYAATVEHEVQQIKGK